MSSGSVWRVVQIYRGFFRRLRRIFYKQVMGSVGAECVFCDGILIENPSCIYLGNHVRVNNGVILQACEGAQIKVGNNVVFSYGCKLITGGIDYKNSEISRDHIASDIVIEDGVWIGAGAIILPGVTIGRGAKVAAGAVVTKNVNEFQTVVGVPAGAAKKRNYEVTS